MFLRVILSKKEQRKLEIFQFMETLQTGDYTVNFFRVALNLPHTSTQTLLAEMDMDFHSCENCPSTLFNKDGTIRIIKGEFTYDYYFTYLVKQSIPYQSLLYMLLSPEKTLTDFCQEKYISYASAMRYLQPLAEYMRFYGLGFNRSRLKFRGDERLIRMVLFNFLWNGTKGQELYHFTPAELTEIFQQTNAELLFAANPILAKESQLFTEIIYLRTLHGFYAEDDPRYDEVLDEHVLPNTHFLAETFSIPQEHLLAESRFIQFLMFYSPRYQHATDPRLTEMHRYYHKENNINRLLQAFSAYWSEKITFDNSDVLENPALHANLFNVAFFHFVFSKKVPTLFDLMYYFKPPRSALFDTLNQKIRFFFEEASQEKEFSWLKDCTEILAKLFTWLTLNLFEKSDQNQPLRVAVIMESDQLFVQEIYQFLEDLSFVSLQPVANERLENCDYLICSSAFYLPEKCQVPSFIFNFFSSRPMNFKDLYEELRREYYQKNKFKEKNADLEETVL
jgi:hypothetical protein